MCLCSINAPETAVILKVFCTVKTHTMFKKSEYLIYNIRHSEPQTWHFQITNTFLIILFIKTQQGNDTFIMSFSLMT